MLIKVMGRTRQWREDMNMKGIVETGGGKMKKGKKVGAGGGGYCCDHCSDSKFPCIHTEKKMREAGSSEQKERAAEGPGKGSPNS